MIDEEIAVKKLMELPYRERALIANAILMNDRYFDNECSGYMGKPDKNEYIVKAILRVFAQPRFGFLSDILKILSECDKE